jgi:hypothetical protein
MTTEEQEILKEAQARLVRWEEYRRKMLTNVFNLLLALATGLLGFIATQEGIPKSNTVWWTYTFLGSSILAAVVGGFSRFYDFRYTTMIVKAKRDEAKNGKSQKDEKKKYRSIAEDFSALTYTCLFLQAIAFSIAVILVCNI